MILPKQCADRPKYTKNAKSITSELASTPTSAADQPREPRTHTPSLRAPWSCKCPINEVQPSREPAHRGRNLDVRPQPCCCRQRPIRASRYCGVSVHNGALVDIVHREISWPLTKCEAVKHIMTVTIPLSRTEKFDSHDLPRVLAPSQEGHAVINVRVHGNSAHGMEHVRRLPCPHAHRDWCLER